jgi:CheY-like chemotaxis protein
MKKPYSAPKVKKIALKKAKLLLHNQAAIRETLSIVLRRYGFIVTLAATVAQALEEVEKQDFDILLCDLNIERESDGYEVIRAMQKINPNRGTPRPERSSIRVRAKSQQKPRGSNVPSQNFTNNLLGWTRSAGANLRIFSSERLRSPRSTSAA